MFLFEDVLQVIWLLFPTCIQDDLYARCHQIFDTTEITEVHREKPSLS